MRLNWNLPNSELTKGSKLLKLIYVAEDIQFPVQLAVSILALVYDVRLSECEVRNLHAPLTR